MSKKRPKIDEPVMSDRTLLLNVEDLINVAFGPIEGNTVDFKAVQTILHILARELRLLEQDVEIRIDEEKDKLTELHQSVEHIQTEILSDNESDEEDEHDEAEVGVRKKKHDKKKMEKGEKGEKVVKGEKGERGEKSKRSEKGEKPESGGKMEKEEKVGKGGKSERAGNGERGEKDEKREKRRDMDDDVDRSKGKGQQENKGGTDGDKKKGTDRKTLQKTDKSIETDKSQGDDDDDGRTDSSGRKDGTGRSKTKQRDEKQGSQEYESAGGRKGGAAEDDKQSKRGIEKAAGISVSEETRRGVHGNKEKVLVVEKGPTTRDSRTRVGSIEVVTRSEFELLESKIQKLLSMKGPLPMPTMPDNTELKSALAKGTASLPDTMEAMQVNARVRAAENALTCMAHLLTQLAAAGAIPPELADRVQQMTSEVQELTFAAETGMETISGIKRTGVGTETHKSVAIDPLSQWDSGEGKRMPDRGHISSVGLGGSLAATISSTVAEKMSTGGLITQTVSPSELEEALLLMKTELLTNISNMTAKNSMTAEQASSMAKSVSDKLEVALKLDDRISTLFSLTNDYAEQLKGFDSGLSTQMKSFQEQMSQMRSDLQGGLTQLNAANNNGESAAIQDLRTAYDSLVTELETTLHSHSTLILVQKQLGDELRALLEWVEMLREQKADRDEVKDGLRDKADLSRLKGLLNENAFEESRLELQQRLEKCYEKFHKQDSVWMGALKDLSGITSTKAELTLLMGLKDTATEKLQELHDTLFRLETMLGEPKAALLMRKLSAGAQCGACLTPALMAPNDANYGTPAPLPALILRDQRPDMTEQCTTQLEILAPPDTREHICNRWVGGSHTLISEHVTRERAPPIQIQGVPTKRYTGYGSDGRLYQLEEELQPCVECNLPPEDMAEDPAAPSAAGDGDHKQ